MANSTWFQATNSVLNLAVLPQVVSTAVFDGGQLSKTQNAAKYKIDFAHRHLTLQVRTYMDNAKFSLPIQAGMSDYPLDLGISGEALRYHGWYNITPGGNYDRHLKFMLYEDYMNKWPDQTVVWSGPPQYIVQLPYDRQTDFPTGAFNPIPMVRVYPIPDTNYTLQYQAALNAPPLISSSSQILWPTAYEHGIWAWAWKFLEVDLAEGREMMLDALVDQVLSRIKLASQPASEVRKGVRMMRMNQGGYGRGRQGGYFG
jgi:hypothetical protein